MSLDTDASELSPREMYEREALGREFDRKHRINNYDRRKPFGGLSDDDVEELVARVSQRVIQSFYQELGRTVATRFLQFLGIIATAIGVWLAGGKFNWWKVP